MYETNFIINKNCVTVLQIIGPHNFRYHLWFFIDGKESLGCI